MIINFLLALFLAKHKGYKIKPLFKSYVFYPYFLVEILYIIVQISTFMNNYSFVKYSTIISMLFMYSMIIPMLFYKLYKQGLIGSSLILIGTMLNKFVMAQNGGKMPVYASISRLTGYYNELALISVDSTHMIGDGSVKFKILTDYIDIGWSILSIGDLLIHSFTFIIVYFSIREINLRQIARNTHVNS